MLRLDKQLLVFIAVGLSQLFVEALLYVAGTFFGVEPALANICARILAAAGGYFVHSRLTFMPRKEARHRAGAGLRYAAVWITLTAVSTFGVAAAADTFGLQGSWLAKPLIDCVLAMASFVLLRSWVFQPAC